VLVLLGNFFLRERSGTAQPELRNPKKDKKVKRKATPELLRQSMNIKEMLLR
jgi:hypothetical protein